MSDPERVTLSARLSMEPFMWIMLPGMAEAGLRVMLKGLISTVTGIFTNAVEHTAAQANRTKRVSLAVRVVASVCPVPTGVPAVPREARNHSGVQPLGTEARLTETPPGPQRVMLGTDGMGTAGHGDGPVPFGSKMRVNRNPCEAELEFTVRE
jgi:hypothetical protein